MLTASKRPPDAQVRGLSGSGTIDTRDLLSRSTVENFTDFVLKLQVACLW